MPARRRSDSQRAKPPKPYWTCPVCGRQFVAANTYHSCGHYELDGHFAGKAPRVRALYEGLLATLRQFGPVSAHPIKTRIIFQAETQFASALPRKRWLEGYFWLRRRAAHPAIRKVEMHVFRDYGHVFRLAQPEDLDEALVELLHEAYLTGGSVLPRRR